MVRGRGPRGDPVRIEAASLNAIAQRHVFGFTSCRETAGALQDALASDEPAGPELDAALAELRAVGAVSQSFMIAAASFTDVEDPVDELALRLLELAGADLDAARAWRAAHPPGGFTPPQAPAYGRG